MHTKLTLRLDEELIARAKEEAGKRGKSVSRMVAEFFVSLGSAAPTTGAEPPSITASLLGVLRGRKAVEADYRRRLREKYL